jgi:hypothetical protein
VLSERFSASAMLQVPQPPPSTLLIVMPFISTGELSTCVPSPMPCCSAAISANTLNDDPVGRPACAKSNPLASVPP